MNLTSPSPCRAGDQCGNRSMQLQTQPLLAVNQAGAVVATHDLAAGAFIGQYTGQVRLLNSGGFCRFLTLVI